MIPARYPPKVIEAARVFDEGVAKLCEEAKGARFNRATENRIRTVLWRLARTLYAQGGFLLDAQTREPIWDPDLIHLAVAFERNELTFSVTRKRGKPS